MTERFAERVAHALAEIPHGEDCAWEIDPNYGGGFCTCDREQRIARRVAAAIDAADTEALLDEPDHRAIVLAALRSASLGEREEPYG